MATDETAGTVPAAAAGPKGRSVRFWVLAIGAVTFLAGLLFGYDQGVISGALKLVKQDLDIGTFASEIITSWVTLGALAGALVAGVLADRIGRRKVLVAAGVLFILGAVVEAVADSAAVLTVGRVITGIGVGFASTIAPLYAAEMAPQKWRGRMVSSYQLAITFGIFVAYLVDDALTESGAWRTMFLLAVVPGALLMIGVFLVPESARWLAKMGRKTEARDALAHVTPPDKVDAELAAVEAQIATEAEGGEASWREVFSPRMRKALVVGVGLSIFQQITGINAIIYYANEIFDRAGLTSTNQQTTATLYCVGLVNVLATFIAVAYVDRFGRRPLLFAGLVGMFVSLTAVGIGFATTGTTDTGAGASLAGIVTMVALVVFIASFAFSLGPVVWTIISEIFPSRVRGRAVSLATAVNWGAAFLVTQFFLTVVNEIGEAATFFVLALMCVFAYIFVWRYVPETRGRSLEEIQEQWARDEPASEWEDTAPVFHAHD
ncbi:MAG: sugar porter family MFS transporter [Solirubrobacteraceae bacterium]